MGARSHGGQEEEEAALFVYQNLLVHVLILIVYVHRTLLIACLFHREAVQHGTSERGQACCFAPAGAQNFVRILA